MDIGILVVTTDQACGRTEPGVGVIGGSRAVFDTQPAALSFCVGRIARRVVQAAVLQGDVAIQNERAQRGETLEHIHVRRGCVGAHDPLMDIDRVEG